MKKLLSRKLLSLGLCCCLIFSVTAFKPSYATEPQEAAQPALAVNAKSAVLMEQETGKVLFESNPHEKLPPASVTKIMTMLLIMEAIDSGKIGYDDVVTASERAKSMGGSTIYLDTNEQMSVRDLLKGIAVASANDGCVAMAEHLAGSEQEFVNQMNARAKELGMNDTNFVNTNGLDDPNHYTSAFDIALMSRELLKHEDIFQFTTIWMDSLRGGKFQLANTNKLIRFYEGANGLKTGSTSVAGCCLSGTAKRDGMQLIAVVLGAPTSNDRFNGAKAMLDYGFANYGVYEGLAKDTVVGEVTILKGEAEKVSAQASDTFHCLLSKAEMNSVEQSIEIQQEIYAPLSTGTQLGTLKYTLNGQELGSVPLVANKEVGKMSPFKLFARLMRQMMTGK